MDAIGRKLHPSIENPIDNMLIEYCEGMVDKLYSHGITPNMVTITGIVFRIISIWGLFKGYKIIFLIGAILGYYCDCLDGHLARKFNMCTVFGDLLDHISDMAFQVGIIWYIISKRNNPLFIPAIIFYLVFLLIFLVHMGCQQKHFNCNNIETLDALKTFCQDKLWIHFTKFFGFVFFSIIVGMLF